MKKCILESEGGKNLSERQVNAVLIALWSQVHGFAKLWLAGNLGDPNDRALMEILVSDSLSSITPKWQE